jgi:hypothetical protein
LYKVEPLGETPLNLTEGKKKDRFVEISVETAKELLLIDYDDNQALNNSYKLREQFQYAVPERNHGFFYYQRSRYVPTNEPFEYQREQIRLKGAREYDSLVSAHTTYMIYVSDYIENDDFKSLGSLQFILAQFPALDNGGALYHKAVLDDVVENDPELYFTYMETIDESRRSHYFWLLDKEHTRILKNTKTKSPVKGEMRSFKLKNNLVSMGIITLAVAVDAAFIGGIVYLITLL